MTITRSPVIALAALLAGLSAASCHKAPPEQYAGQSTLAEMSKMVHEKISDPATAAAVVALLDSAEAVSRSADSALSLDIAALARTNAEPGATRAELQAILERIEARRRADLQKMIALRFQMKALTTPAQWKEIVDHEQSIIGQLPAVPAEARY